MAVTVVPRDSIGERIGTGLGAGLGYGLQALANHKIGQWQQRHQREQSYENLKQLPIPDTYARFLSNYDPETQIKLLQTFGQAGLLGQPEAAQEQLAVQEPETGMQALQQQPQLQPQVNTQQLLQSLGAPGTFQGDQQGIINQLQRQISGEQPDISQFMQMKPVAQPTREETSRVQPVRTEPSRPQAGAQKPKTIIDAIAQGYQTPQMQQAERHFQQKQAAAEKKLTSQEKREAFKATKAERKEIIDKGRAARQNLHDLDRMEELEKEGKLDTPGYIEGLKRSGFDIPALMNPGSEEFQKIAANFLKDAKTYFGSRVSNYEIEQFLKTIPSLSQSPEGRKRVIANLKNLSRGALEYNNALKEIMAENKGIPPYDLLEQVDSKVQKREDALAKKFKEDLAKPVPKAQSKYVTALQASIGNIVGRLPSALKGAGIGAAYGALHGSKGGPIGTGAGALIGGALGLSGVI